ncbi:MAG TPA: geranylgeranylglycerol-phosphate geranylgeranyltransferase [Salinivirgaceae bacterium]|nr:geranylgeranylglycerol-phosphate geranylgeranyltransferase [Salinivirgaceae bacterium]
MYLIRLTRPLNLFIVAATMLAIRYGITVPNLSKANLQSALPTFDFVLIIFSTILLGASGYIINDYFDQKIDRINRPNETIIGTKVHRRMAILLHWILNILGLLLGSLLAFRLKLYWIIGVYFVVTVLFWFYSTYFKRIWYKGNILVSLLAGMVPFQVVLFEFAWLIKEKNLEISDLYQNSQTFKIFLLVVIYSAFAFITNFIREILKDFKDIKGDARFGRKTLPLIWRPKKAKWFVQILTSLLILTLILLYLLIKDRYQWTLGVYLIFFIIAPLVATLIYTYKARETNKYAIPERLMKIVMVTGIIACYIFGPNL